MHERQMDAITYVRKYGRPNLFITMTTNPKWSEITTILLQVKSVQVEKEKIEWQECCEYIV